MTVSDNFGAESESETSSLVTAICHSCLDIVHVSQIVCTKKVLSANCPALNTKVNF